MVMLLQFLAWHQNLPNRHLPNPIEGWPQEVGCCHLSSSELQGPALLSDFPASPMLIC